MTFFLSTIAIIISILAIFVNQWITLLPQLGIAFQYHKRRVQIAVAILALLCAGIAFIIQPSNQQIVVFIIVIILTPLSGFNHAKKTLVALDRPTYVAAPAADLPEESMIMGYLSTDNNAYAWTLDTLIPHHLINDVLEEQPLLVAW